MKTILAFDDFVLNRSDTTRRVFKQPQWRMDLAYTDPANPRGIWPTSVVPALEGGYMLLYSGVPDPTEPIDDEHMAGFMAWSHDGLCFEPYERLHIYPEYPHMRGLLSEDFGIYAYLDAKESRPEYRYKSPHARYGYKGGRLVEEEAHLLVSRDLIRWERINDAAVTPSYVDCYPSLLRNPVTGRFQVTTRRRWGERRVCLVESADLLSWSMPRAIVHPLPDDEPLTHLYSMPQFYYEPGEIFLGLLWKHVMPFNRIMDGPVTSEYAYSYDGLMWNRTKAPMFPVAPRGEYGSGSCYIVSMVDRGEDVVFYAAAHREEHGGIPGGMREGLPPPCALIPGTLKRNRFVCIDSGKGRGELITQWLRLKAPGLFLNANIPFGSLRAELRAGEPVEGYSFDDFLPIGGDCLDEPLRWRGGGLEKFAESGQWVQLHIEFEQAEVYAITGDFDFTINTRAPVYDRL